MKSFDKIYLNIYWVVSKKLNAQNTTIWALNVLLSPPLIGFIVFFCGLSFWVISLQLNLKFIILIAAFISYFLSEKLIKNYYTKEKQKEIIQSNEKPGFYRYFIFAFLLLLSLSLMVILSLMAGVIIHRL
jgi:hypothetical protein